MTNYIENKFYGNEMQTFIMEDPKHGSKSQPKPKLTSVAEMEEYSVESHELETRQTYSAEERCSNIRENSFTKADSDQRNIYVCDGERRDDAESATNYNENGLDETLDPNIDPLYNDSSSLITSYSQNQYMHTLESKKQNKNNTFPLDREPFLNMQYSMMPAEKKTMELFQNELNKQNLEKKDCLIKENLKENIIEYNAQRLDSSKAEDETNYIHAKLNAMKNLVCDSEMNAFNTANLRSKLGEHESFSSTQDNFIEKSRDKCHSAHEMLRSSIQKIDHIDNIFQSEIDKIEETTQNNRMLCDLDENTRNNNIDMKDKIIKNLQEQCSKKQISLTKLSEENTGSKTKALDLERQMIKFIAQKEDLENKFAEVAEEHQILFETGRIKSKIDEKKISELKENILNITSRLETSTEKNSFYESVIQTLQKDMHVMKEKNDAFQFEMQGIKQKHIENISLLRDGRKKLEESEIIIKNLRNSLQKKEYCVQSLQQELTKLTSFLEENFNSGKKISSLQVDFNRKKQQYVDLEKKLESRKTNEAKDVIACQKDDDSLNEDVIGNKEPSKAKFLNDEHIKKQLKDNETNLFCVEQELNSLKQSMVGKVLIEKNEHDKLKQKEARLVSVEEELHNVRKLMEGKVIMNQSAVEEFRKRDKLFSLTQKEIQDFHNSMVGKVLVRLNELQEYQTYEALLTATRRDLISLKNSMKGKVLVKEDDLKHWTEELSGARQIVDKQNNFDELTKKYQHSLELLKEKESDVEILNIELEDMKVKISKNIDQKDIILSLENELKEMKDHVVETKLKSKKVVAAAEKDLTEITQEKEMLLLDLSRFKTKNINLESKIDELQKTNSEHSKHLSLSEKQKEKLSLKITSLENTFNATNDKIAEAMTQLEKENKELKDRLDENDHERSNLSCELKKLEEKCMVQSNCIKEANVLIDELKSEICSLNAVCDGQNLEKDRLTVELNEKEKEIIDGRDELSRLKLLEGEISALKRQNSEIEDNYQKILIDRDTKIAISSQERELELNQMNALKKECQSLRDKLTNDSLNLAEVQANKTQILSLEKMISKYREDASNVSKDHDEAIKTLEMDLNNATMKKNELSQNVKDLRRRNKELEDMVSNLKTSAINNNMSDMSSLLTKVENNSKLEEKISTLTEKLKLQDEEKYILKTKLQNIKSYEGTSNEEFHELKSRIKSLESLVGSVTKEKERYNEKFLKVRYQLREALDQRRITEKKLQSQSLLLLKAEAVMTQKNTATLNSIIDALNKTKMNKVGGTKNTI